MDIKEIISRGEKVDIEFKSWEKIKDIKELIRILTKESVEIGRAHV